MSPSFTTAARWVPSELEAIELQYRLWARLGDWVWSVQVQNELEYTPVQMSPPFATAAICVPSALEAIELHLWTAATWLVQAQVELEYTPVQRVVPSTAARYVPVESEAIDCQFRLWTALTAFWSVQVAPEFAEVQMSPPYTPAARWVPSELDAIDSQFWLWAVPVEVWSVQVQADVVVVVEDTPAELEDDPDGLEHATTPINQITTTTDNNACFIFISPFRFRGRHRKSLQIPPRIMQSWPVVAADKGTPTIAI
jgi:hypothetical protein